MNIFSNIFNIVYIEKALNIVILDTYDLYNLFKLIKNETQNNQTRA